MDFDELDDLEEERAGLRPQGDQGGEPEDVGPAPGQTIDKYLHPHTLNLQEARAVMNLLAREHVSKDFQDTLHAAWQAAEGDAKKQSEAREQVSFPVHLRIAESQGFGATSRGVESMGAALLPFVSADPEAAHRNALIQWLLNPDAQKTQNVPTGPTRYPIRATAHIYDEEDKYMCAVGININDTVRSLKENIYLHSRQSWLAQRLYLRGDGDELFDQMVLSRIVRVASTASFRVLYRSPEVVSWLTKLQKSMELMPEVPAELLADADFMVAVMQMRATAFSFAAPELQSNRDFILRVLKHCGQALQWVAPELKSDKELVITAVQQDPWALELAAPDMQSDREVVLRAIQKDSWALQFASAELRADGDIIDAAVRKDPSIMFSCLPELQNDEKVVIKAIQRNTRLFQSLPAAMKANREVALTALRQDGRLLEHTAEVIQADRECVMAAVMNHGGALRYASRDLRADDEVALTAVKQQAVSIGFVPCQTLEMALAAIEGEAAAFQFVDRSLHRDVYEALGLRTLPEWMAPFYNPVEDNRKKTKPCSKPKSEPVRADLRRHLVVLSLPATASRDEIKRRYHDLVLKYHPDKYKGADPESAQRQFVKIHGAYEALQSALVL